MASSQHSRAFLLATAGLVALVAPGVASAQKAAAPAQGAQLEEIIVTAQKRAQRLQDVPVSETALPATQLLANRFTTVKDLDQMVPNTAIRTVVGGATLPTITMRGLVSLGSALGADRGVAPYIDGVYQGSANAAEFQLADIETVEVLRGPQGTLFGRNSTGGAIIFTTPDPKGRFGVKATGTVGNYDQYRFATTVNSPQVGPFSALVSYVHDERRGDLKNLGRGTTWNFAPGNAGRAAYVTSPENLGDSNVNAWAFKLKFEPSDSFNAVYKFDWNKQNLTVDGQGLRYVSPGVAALFAGQPNPALMTPVQPERPDAVNNAHSTPSETVNWGHGLTVNYRVNDQVSLKNILGYRYMTWSAPWQAIDGAGGIVTTGNPGIFAGLGISALVPLLPVGSPFLFQATNTTGTDRQYSDELQLNVNTQHVTFTGGLLWFKLDSVRSPFGVEGPPGLGVPRSGAFRFYPNYLVPFQGPALFTNPALGAFNQASGYFGRHSEVSTKSTAVYGQAEVHITPQLDFVGGVRYTKDRKTGLDNSNLSGVINTSYVIDYEKSRITYNLGLNYKINNDILTYVKYVTGYISGGSLAGITYKPETAASWELGLKADWLDRTLRTNVALFDVSYENIQLPTSGAVLRLSCAATDLTCQNNLGGITQAIITQGDAKARGFELETSYLPTRQLQFSGGLGLTDFNFTSINPLLLIGQQDYHANARPKWTMNLSGQYTSDPLFDEVHLTARVDASWKSGQWGINGVPSTLTGVELNNYLAAGRIDASWLVNGRLALEGFKVGGGDATVALWARNIFNDRSPQYEVAFSTFLISANFERARTFGVDVSFDF
jgi:iron complex outermembrane receptor protein